jgi:hypothetical protein
MSQHTASLVILPTVYSGHYTEKLSQHTASLAILPIVCSGYYTEKLSQHTASLAILPIVYSGNYTETILAHCFPGHPTHSLQRSRYWNYTSTLRPWSSYP